MGTRAGQTSREWESFWFGTLPARRGEELPVSQRICAPTEGRELCLKRAIWDLASNSRGVLMNLRGSVGDS